MPEPRQFSLSTTEHPTPADGQHRTLTWTAPVDVRIRRVETWIGTNAAGPDGSFPPVDTYTTVFAPDGQVLSFFGLDHYARFAGPHQLDKLFPTDLAPLVRKGESVYMEHYCQAVGGVPSASATQVIVTYLEA